MNRILALARTFFTVALRGPKSFNVPRSIDRLVLWLVWVLGPLLTLAALIYTIVSFSIWALLLTIVIGFVALCGLAWAEVIRRLSGRRHFATMGAMLKVGKQVPSSLVHARRNRSQILSLDSYSLSATDRIAFSMGRRPGDAPVIATHAGVENPRITVVVPLFNDGWFVGAALASLQAQTLQEWECLVIDDASTDDGFDVALAFAAKDKRIKVLRHDRNRGLAASRNTGIANATAPYVTFLDSDDYIYADGLRVRLDAATSDPLQAGVYCAWESVAENVPVRYTQHKPAPDRYPATFISSGWEVPFIATAPIVRTDVLRATGGFNEELRTAEDFEFWARIMRGGLYFDYAPYVGLAYRQRQGSMIRRSPLGHLAVVQGVWKELSKPWENPWNGAPDPVTVSLPDAMGASAGLPRTLNFFALSLWLNPKAPIDESLRPPAWLWRQRSTAEVAGREAAKALNRLGADTPENIAVLTKRLLALAPKAPTEYPKPQPDQELQNARRARVSHLSGVRVADVSELAEGGPFFALVPQSRYHVFEVGPLGAELESRGVRVAYLIPPEAPKTVIDELAWYTDTVYGGEFDQLKGMPVIGCFILNDWAPSTGKVMEAVRQFGGTTFAKVEGVQDFQDADTGRIRKPYQWADIILGQGPNDVAALPMMDVRVIGSTRLERMTREPEVDAAFNSVLINYNFTYGVLAEAQDMWIRSTVDGIRQDNLPYTISLHPAQKFVPNVPEVKEHIGRDPFSHLILRSGALVTRFSTVVFEAMARGVPAIYYNPHGEKVPTFNNPQGSFLLVTDAESFPAALLEAESWRGSYRARSQHFFDAQISIDPDRPSEKRAADVILEFVGSRL